MQNTFLGLPLVLIPEQVKLLLELGVIIIKHSATAQLEYAESIVEGSKVGEAEEDIGLESEEWEWPSTEEEILKFGVFKDLYNKEYYITPGLKFGGDYLLYPGTYKKFYT
ncbi:tRNA-splicing endonuclease subunit Sen34 [Smittium culicis]|uniref:tRNA-intron lyase n=1 Tax=Smittium culicis TaxID=133412 RepID=A0A1R1X5X3_9FUNG|nr:tRNA-splicing endonuclease subunit Sen34 [Smittium culicis]